MDRRGPSDILRLKLSSLEDDGHDEEVYDWV